MTKDKTAEKKALLVRYYLLRKFFLRKINHKNLDEYEQLIKDIDRFQKPTEKEK